jgi:hypothetical protein
VTSSFTIQIKRYLKGFHEPFNDDLEDGVKKGFEPNLKVFYNNWFPNSSTLNLTVKEIWLQSSKLIEPGTYHLGE